MKPRAEGGVVDKDLNVYGTKNLKIAGDSNTFNVNRRSFNLSGECGFKYV